MAGISQSNTAEAAIKLLGIACEAYILYTVRAMEKENLLKKTTDGLPPPDAVAGTVTVTVTPQKGSSQ